MERNEIPVKKLPAAISEQGVIDAINRRFPSHSSQVLLGIGDDAAVVRAGGLADSARRLNSVDLVYTTDILIEGVHFDLRYMSLADIGYKALAVNLSDIAAMGGTPRFALGNLGVPAGATNAKIRELLDGVAAVAQPAAVDLIGGDTVAAPQWVVGFTVIGELQGPPLTRHGAQPGDILWHTGVLGLSQTALHMLWGGSAGIPEQLRRAHLRPVPQLSFGSALKHSGLATACMDLSDSLSQCALQLANASGVGFELDFRAYPFSVLITEFLATHAPAAKRSTALAALPQQLSPQRKRLVFHSLTDFLLASAEDYELLFTTPAAAETPLLRLAAIYNVNVTRLGTVVPVQHGCKVINELAQPLPLLPVGFEHLGTRRH